MNRRFPVIAIIATLPFVIGCAAGSARASKGLKTTSLQQRIGPGQLTPVEIGGEVTSFADSYMSLLTYVADLLFDQPLSPEIRATTYGFLLDTGYGVYTVASDPNPVVSLFDMVVLVTLTRMSAEEHWVQVLGERASALVDACRRGEKEIWSIAEKVLTPEERQAMRDVIAQWRADHPDLRRVSFVRFSDFSEQRRQMHATAAEAKSLFALFGLDPLGSLDPATRELERSRLLAERVFYFTKRLLNLIQANATHMYLEIAASSDAEQFRTNLQTFSDVSQDLAATARQLPDEFSVRAGAVREAAVKQLQVVLAAERQAAIDQIAESIRGEREAIIETLKLEEPLLRGMMTELRQTVEAGTELVQAIQVLAPPGEERDAEAVRIEDVQAVLEQTTLAAEGLNQLVQSIDRVLAPDDLEVRLSQLELALIRAEAHGRSLIDRTFVLGGLVVVVIFVASVVKMILQRRVNARLAVLSAPER